MKLVYCCCGGVDAVPAVAAAGTSFPPAAAGFWAGSSVRERVSVLNLCFYADHFYFCVFRLPGSVNQSNTRHARGSKSIEIMAHVAKAKLSGGGFGHKFVG